MAGIDHVDLVVVGAGWFGLAGAKTYLQIHPEANIVVLADNETIGGVWANDRLYPGLKTNNILGALEYSEFPMTTEKYGVKPGEYIPGSVIHQYLEDFAKEYNVYDKIRFVSKALSAEHKDGGGWIITIASSVSPANFDEYKISTSKLIVATGLTSEAFVPSLPGTENFAAPLFHAKEFPNHLDTLETAKKVCVFGGAKSSYDMAYAYASKGIHVDWIIRESGHGPGWMSESPCIYGDYDGYGTIRSWLHGTTAGRWFVDKYWENSNAEIKMVNNYDGHPETAKLKPWSNSFFVGSMLSILNHDTDIFELLRKGVISVHIGDIVNLSANTVNLSNGDKIQTDAFVCATGWKHIPPLEFLPKGIDLGLPHTPEPGEPDALIERADEEILARFPRLRDQPISSKKAKSMEGTPEGKLEPFRLFRFMVSAQIHRISRYRFYGLHSISLYVVYVPISSTLVEPPRKWFSSPATTKVQIPELADTEDPPAYTPYDTPAQSIVSVAPPDFSSLPSSSSPSNIPSSIPSSIPISNPVSSSRSVSLSGPLRILDSVSASSSVTLYHHVTVTGPVKSSSKVHLYDDVTVEGDVKSSSSVVLDGGEEKGGVRILGTVKSSSSVEMTGDVYVQEDVKSSSKVVLEGVGGLVRIGGKVDASGSVSIKGRVEVEKVESSGKIVIQSLEKQKVVFGELDSRGGMEIEGDVEIRSEFKASGNVRIIGRLHVYGDFTVKAMSKSALAQNSLWMEKDDTWELRAHDIVSEFGYNNQPAFERRMNIFL
ncbi:hypothetical protein EYC84_008155 [Monilinia fructicola]|uniref:FAD/NAD(P)-binding domain-containing protein n=1 Tax=Monilinia fructicola TaxID=38448 RepID=A0A5M9JIN4_MONFR|nr:hypothetical protein EYC84_008155 [Monilinia fructicola]